MTHEAWTFLDVPDSQVWRLHLSCHCNELLIDGGRGPDLSKPWICPSCKAMAMPVSAVRFDEQRRRLLVSRTAEATP
jgi:hypothetical protein